MAAANKNTKTDRKTAKTPQAAPAQAAPAAPQAAPATKRARGPVTNWSVVAGRYMTNGKVALPATMDHVDAKRVAEYLATFGRDDLASEIRAAFPAPTGGLRGRKGVEDGTVRSYKLQQLDPNSDPFLRLPIPWGVKGQPVTVKFAKGEIVVKVSE